MAPYLSHDGRLWCWLQIPVVEGDIEFVAIVIGDCAAGERRRLRTWRRRRGREGRGLLLQDAAEHAG